MLPIKIDIHTHSIASGHATKDTITDMAKEASRRGLQVLAITEHGPKTEGSCTNSYFQSMKYAPKKRFGIDILYGCEVNILDVQGNLDMSASDLMHLDVSIASLHTQNIKPGTVEDNTNAVIGAIRNPNIDIIGHPDDVKYPLDYVRIVKEAMNNHVLLELNNGSLYKDSYRGNTLANDITYLQLCKAYSYPIIIGSDSHGREHIGDFKEALSLLQSLNFPQELILNYNVEVFFRWIYKKK
jgi:putative hydrolase